MGAEEKMRAKAEEAAGAARKKVGEETGDREMQAKGTAEEAKGKGREAGEEVKEKAREAAEHARERLDRT